MHAKVSRGRTSMFIVVGLRYSKKSVRMSARQKFILDLPCPLLEFEASIYTQYSNVYSNI